MEWEVRKFYWKLYRKETSVIDKGEILERIGDIKKISEHDKERLDKEISMEEVSNTLKNTRNNVAPGAGGFTGAFYKVFWKFLKVIFLGAIHEIFENKELPLKVRLGIIALIPKGSTVHIQLATLDTPRYTVQVYFIHPSVQTQTNP